MAVSQADINVWWPVRHSWVDVVEKISESTRCPNCKKKIVEESLYYCSYCNWGKQEHEQRPPTIAELKLSKQGEKPMSTSINPVATIRDQNVDAETKAARHFELEDFDGDMTYTGKDTVLQYIYRKNRSDIVKMLQEAETAEKATEAK